MKVTIINAGGNNDYIYGFMTGLSKITEINSDVIDSDRSIELFSAFKNIRLLPFIENYGYHVAFIIKPKRLILYYYRLLRYAWKTENQIFHMQWENKFKFVDRILLTNYYKLLGKILILTAHNLDAVSRDGQKSWYNRITLHYMYHQMDHIIVHTESMKRDMIDKFEVPASKIEVIPHGINVKGGAAKGLKVDDRKSLDISPNAKVMLIFGSLTRYKGIEMMLHAMPAIIHAFPTSILLIAGNSTKKERYFQELKDKIANLKISNNVILHNRWIQDNEVEKYFNAADCLVLPYRRIFQSGVPFMAYRFGLPVIATRVGGLPETIIEGKTGYLCDPNILSLYRTVLKYFQSPLYQNLDQEKFKIKETAEKLFSWDIVADKTYSIYRNAISKKKSLSKLSAANI